MIFTPKQAVEKPVKVFPLNHSGNGRMRKRDLMGQTSDFTWFQQVSTGFDRLKKQVSAKLGGSTKLSSDLAINGMMADQIIVTNEREKWFSQMSQLLVIPPIPGYPGYMHMIAYDCI